MKLPGNYNKDLDITIEQIQAEDNVNLSNGPEEIKIYSGFEALKYMNRYIPDFAK